MTQGRTAIALIGYGLLSLAALGWCLAAGRWNIASHPDPLLTLSPWWSVGLSLLSGALVAVFVVRSTRWLVYRARWAKTLHSEFRSLLGPISSKQIAVLACGSGIAEELFFRGAMQPAFGLWLASLVFGAAHFAPLRGLWPWTVWAAVIGVVFGAIFEVTGSLVGVVLAHIAINYENMHFIECFDPLPPERLGSAAERSIPIPHLVATDFSAQRTIDGGAVDGGRP